VGLRHLRRISLHDPQEGLIAPPGEARLIRFEHGTAWEAAAKAARAWEWEQAQKQQVEAKPLRKKISGFLKEKIVGS